MNPLPNSSAQSDASARHARVDAMLNAPLPSLAPLAGIAWASAIWPVLFGVMAAAPWSGSLPDVLARTVVLWWLAVFLLTPIVEWAFAPDGGDVSAPSERAERVHTPPAGAWIAMRVVLALAIGALLGSSSLRFLIAVLSAALGAHLIAPALKTSPHRARLIERVQEAAVWMVPAVLTWVALDGPRPLSGDHRLASSALSELAAWLQTNALWPFVLLMLVVALIGIGTDRDVAAAAEPNRTPRALETSRTSWPWLCAALALLVWDHPLAGIGVGILWAAAWPLLARPDNADEHLDPESGAEERVRTHSGKRIDFAAIDRIRVLLIAAMALASLAR